MLCLGKYFEAKDESLLDNEIFDNIYNLLSVILIQEVVKLVKSGVIKDYVGYTEVYPLFEVR